MKTKHNNSRGIRSLLIGTTAGLLLFLISSLVTALILTKSDLSYRTIRSICFAVTMVSGFFSGYLGRRGVQLKGILAGAISSLVLTVIILCVFLAVNGFSCGKEVFLLLPAGVVCGMLGGIVSSNLR